MDAGRGMAAEVQTMEEVVVALEEQVQKKVAVVEQ